VSACGRAAKALAVETIIAALPYAGFRQDALATGPLLLNKGIGDTFALASLRLW
jgi:hypothetical protein